MSVGCGMEEREGGGGGEAPMVLEYLISDESQGRFSRTLSILIRSNYDRLSFESCFCRPFFSYSYREASIQSELSPTNK